ncbi:Putative BZIP transcription factor JlbA/IDI-4 [Aspergillus calidoustus]|uniref:Putative BZIP transcription factor JlbA/IDI-4 n=1 Tax=Aspergillus calidoustus TaxID=454130 RepID=A0A0U5G0E8_ASPCI|nr:Putative BZIP transcription factor JlbA/IDI-4 [Aspergillus calidoustus]
MYPGDPALSASSYDNTLTASAGYPGASSVDTSAIDWTALGCLPSGELAGNYLESQGSAVDSPDPPFNPSTNPTTTTTTLEPPTLSLPIQPSTATSTSVPVPVSASPMPSTTLQNPTPSPTRDSSSPREKENPSRISKRQLNTMAARRYRQRRLDRMTQLEEELEAVKRERDELKMRVSKLEGETDALRSMLKEKKGN